MSNDTGSDEWGVLKCSIRELGRCQLASSYTRLELGIKSAKTPVLNINSGLSFCRKKADLLNTSDEAPRPQSGSKVNGHSVVMSEVGLPPGLTGGYGSTSRPESQPNDH